MHTAQPRLRKYNTVMGVFSPIRIVLMLPSVAVSYKQYAKGTASPDFTSVGMAPRGTQIHICDINFTRLLPQGQVGEVCISGPQVSRG